MLSANVGLCVPAAATRLRAAGRQVRAERRRRGDASVQAQLRAVRSWLWAPDTGQAPGRLQLFPVARLQQHRVVVRIEARLRLQAAHGRPVQ